jgi:alpha-ribazole phosphatase
MSNPPAPAVQHKSWKPAEGIPTRLLLLRHGEVDHEARKSLYGQLDVPLSELGVEQSRQSGEALRAFPLRAVYTSDLSRAHLLASEIARHHGLEPRVETALRERHFGHWQGKPWEVIEQTDAETLAAYNADRFTTRVPGGAENFHDVRERVIPCLRKLVARHPGEHIAITAHSGPARMIIAHALGLGIENIFSFAQDYCCLNVIDFFESGRVTVQKLNATHHLADGAALGPPQSL